MMSNRETEVERKADERKLDEQEASPTTSTKKAEVFSTGWMHTDVTGHPYDTRGLYGPKGVKFTPAPGEILGDGTRVTQSDDISIPSAITTPGGVVAATTTTTTRSPRSSSAAATVWRPEELSAEQRKSLAEKTRSDAERDAELARKEFQKAVPNAPAMGASKFIPAGCNGFFATDDFRKELSHAQRNRLPVIQRLEQNLDLKLKAFITDSRMNKQEEFASSSLQQEPISEGLGTQQTFQGSFRVVEMPRTTETTTILTSNVEGGGFAEYAKQHAGLNIIETHKQPIIDNNARVVEEQPSTITFHQPPSVTSTITMPMISTDDLSNRMANTNLGSSTTLMGNEQSFQPQLASTPLSTGLNQNRFIDSRMSDIAGNNITVGNTPLGPSGAPYKSGVESQYVDLNALSTGEMHKDVTGFPYDTRGIAGERGINAEIAMQQKEQAAQLKAEEKRQKDLDNKDIKDRTL